MWTSLACMSWPKLVPSSSLAPKRICSSTAATHVPSNDRQDGEATKPFCDRIANGPALSRSLATHPLFRCREGFPTDLPDQQFPPSRFEDRPVVPGALESGIVFSLDQTAPTHQGFLRHLGERGEDPSLGWPYRFTCLWRLSKSNWGSI